MKRNRTKKIKRKQYGGNDVLIIDDEEKINSGFYKREIQDKNIENIRIVSPVRVIAEQAFEECTSLKKILIKNNVIEIGIYAFWGCTNLNLVELDSNSVKRIGEYAFEGCINLRSIDIPKSVTSIGESAFEDCINLRSIDISKSVISIGKSAFKNCINLESIKMSASFLQDTTLFNVTNPVKRNKRNQKIFILIKYDPRRYNSYVILERINISLQGNIREDQIRLRKYD
jgi:hypothetical protein